MNKEIEPFYRFYESRGKSMRAAEKEIMKLEKWVFDERKKTCYNSFCWQGHILAASGSIFQKDSKECLTEGNGRAKVMKSLRAMVLWKLNSTARKKPMCEFQEKRKPQRIWVRKARKIEPKQTIYHGEFDPGSGRTLAACLTHASRTGGKEKLASFWI